LVFARLGWYITEERRAFLRWTRPISVAAAAARTAARSRLARLCIDALIALRACRLPRSLQPDWSA
jgi:hypothetical protein